MSKAYNPDKENETTRSLRLPSEALADIQNAVETMRKGGVILYPTDTIWGLGCDATNAEAVNRIYAIKQRSDSKALIVLVDSEVKVQFYVKEVPDVAWDIIEMSNKPTTIIYDGARNLAENLLANDGSVGMRVTGEAFSKQLCSRFQKAIVSTSANISGQPAPHNFQEISDDILSQVDYIVKYRQDDTTSLPASTIIKLGAHNDVKIIRQ